jgi:pSer/pThr/pTyr-binding forkhead associated (FHA) protein
VPTMTLPASVESLSALRRVRVGQQGEDVETSIQLHVTGLKTSDRLRITLREAQVVRIGRAAHPGVSIPWDPSISREHADVCWREGKLHAT